jgi:hypothetical protein
MKAHGLDGALRKGLQALGPNSKRVTVAKPRKAVHSIALDELLKSQYPNDPRWDYGIGLKENEVERIAWVEVHPATSSEVDAALQKRAWLKTWLAQHADHCDKTPATFHWVATDAGVHIDTARRRRLSAAGLKMPQSHLRL